MVLPNKPELLPLGREADTVGFAVAFDLEKADPNKDDFGIGLTVGVLAEGATEVKSAQTSSTFAMVTGVIVSVVVEVVGTAEASGSEDEV